MKMFLFILCLLFSISYTYSGTIDPNIPDHRYIEYGKDFKCVGKLCGTYEDNTQFCASAVVIKQNYILTAAHVVKKYKSCNINVEGIDYKVSGFVWPQEFNEDQYGYNDIAIGFCSDSIKLKFYPELYDSDDELNRVCSIAGYGITGNFNTGANILDSKRRAGSNIVEEIDRQLLVCRPSRNNEKKTSLEFLISSGDSGGGLFIDGKLAGINSCVSGIDKKSLRSTYKSESGHTRISVHREWILKKTLE